MIRTVFINKKFIHCAFLATIIFSQESSLKDTSSFLQIGPLINSLPSLDSLHTLDNDTIKVDSSRSTKSINQFPMNASGFFFRGIDLGGNGNSSLNGGLRLQLAGKISNQTSVSGVITDESIPIQPDGSTADLDELDKVYIKVTNPNFKITAGDIESEESNNSFNTYKRKIIGLENEIQIDRRNIKSIIGQSKGTYNRIEIKGQDGNQGPYYLTTVDGISNVVVASGSEKVWLNGRLLKRGDDLDYIIDYSKGEIYFMPKNLIYFDSDIDIEYQYRQSNYSKDYIETGLNGGLSANSSFQIKYISENENLNSAQLSSSQKKEFRQSDQLILEGAYRDSSGEYILIDNIYHYSPEIDFNVERYSVVFSPNEKGLYIRKVSDKNRIYYEYSPESDIGGNRFSPGQNIKAPKGQTLMQFDSNINLGDNSSLFIESAFSKNDNNLYQRKNNLNGSAIRLGFNQKQINLGKLDIALNLEHLLNSKNFNSLGRDRQVDFNESWDINPSITKKDLSISRFSTKINSNQTQIGIDLFELNKTDENRSRAELRLDHRSNFIKNSTMKFNKIRSTQNFDQINSRIVFFKGQINPFIDIKHEYRYQGYKFNDVLIGLDISKGRRSFSLGVGERKDWTRNQKTANLLLSKDSQFLQFDYISINPKGWRQELMYRSRKQLDKTMNNSLSFGSARAALNYRNNQSPLRLDMVFNTQNTMNEYRSVVYDSVGIGRGSYRYDSLLNEYIRDENGAFIANTILLGNFQSGTNFNSIARLSIDFSKWKFDKFKFFKYRFSLNSNYNGPEKNLSQSLKNHTAQLLMLQHRNEWIYQKEKKSNRYRFWVQSNINYNGMDTRGWVDKRANVNGIDSQIPLINNYFLTYDLSIHSNSTSTNNQFQFTRSVRGSYHELGLKKSIPKSIQYEIKSIYYQDRVISDLKDKEVYAIGMKASFIKFFDKTGRIDCRVDYFDANGFSGMPSEALKGISSNRTLRSTISSSFMIDQSLSFNSSLVFINDERYDNFFQISGELRAYF